MNPADAKTAEAADALQSELLVLRCLRGDPAAPGELVARFQRPLLYYLRRLLGDEAEAWDVAQETWLGVFRALGRLEHPRALPAYLYRAARNAALTHLRKRRALADDSAAAAVADDGPAIEDAVFAREEAARLHAALGRLPLAHRDVLTLHFLQDLSVADIADVVGVPAGTVKSRIFHAKRHLRDLLEQDRMAENVTEKTDPAAEPAGLRARLLGVEPANVARLEKLQQEMRTVFVEELKRRDRVSRSVVLLLALAGAAVGGCVTWHINVPPTVLSPGLLRAVWGLFTLSCVGSALYSLYVLRRGRIDFRQQVARERVRLGVVLTMAMLVMLQAALHPTGPVLAWALCAAIWVVIAVGRCLTALIKQSELNTRETILRAELDRLEGTARR